MNHYGRQVMSLAKSGKNESAHWQFLKYRARIIYGQVRRINTIKRKHGMPQS